MVASLPGFLGKMKHRDENLNMFVKGEILWWLCSYSQPLCKELKGRLKPSSRSARPSPTVQGPGTPLLLSGCSLYEMKGL